MKDMIASWVEEHLEQDEETEKWYVTDDSGERVRGPFVHEDAALDEAWELGIKAVPERLMDSADNLRKASREAI